MIKTCAILLLSTLTIGAFAQDKSWTRDEQQYYTTLKSLCQHFKEKTYDTTQRDITFKRFVYFENILADTSKSRVQKVVRKFDALFYHMTVFIDSIGPDNIEAKPTRFFKSNKAFFEPYAEGGDLNEVLPFTLTYFDKRRPNEPIGTLLFESSTHKLLAWIILNQGGYLYFLTFNML